STDAPNSVFRNPAIDLLALYAASITGAGSQVGDGAGIGQRHHLAALRLGGDLDASLAGDQHGALLAEHGGVHPALGSVGGPHPPPGVELSDHGKRVAA